MDERWRCGPAISKKNRWMFSSRELTSANGFLSDPHYWVKVAGFIFLPAWIVECFLREAFLVTAAAGGGSESHNGYAKTVSEGR